MLLCENAFIVLLFVFHWQVRCESVMMNVSEDYAARSFMIHDVGKLLHLGCSFSCLCVCVYVHVCVHVWVWVCVQLLSQDLPGFC